MDRFWEKVNKTDSCWEWTGAKIPDGYGSIRFNGKPQGAHRVSWILNNGEVPNGLFVCHKCDNRLCVRPDHLFLATNRENILDAKSKGRLATGERNGLRKHPESILRGSKHGRSRVNEEQVEEIRSMYALGKSQKEIGAKFGLYHSTVWSIVHGVNWRHLLKEGA